MSTYVGRVGSCCNNYNYQSGMFLGPYLTQDVNADTQKPRVKPYSGWASYKNVKSGQYNRQLCWNCGDFKGFPQTPGVYDLNIVDTPIPLPNQRAMNQADLHYQIYQAQRLRNSSGNCNYLNDNCSGKIYPKRYVKGNWPDEQLIYTNTPARGCNTVKEGQNVCDGR